MGGFDYCLQNSPSELLVLSGIQEDLKKNLFFKCVCLIMGIIDTIIFLLKFELSKIVVKLISWLCNIFHFSYSKIQSIVPLAQEQEDASVD